MMRLFFKPRLVSGGGLLLLEHCKVETHRSSNWDPLSHEETFLIPVRKDSIFRNLFLLRAELLSDAVSILKCTKRTEYVMWNFFQITAPKKQENKSDPHELKVLFLSTLVIQDSAGQSTLRNLS